MSQQAVQPAPIVTLLTDFGASGPYVGSMRATVCRFCRHAQILDITHEIPAHDVAAGAYTLSAAAFWFPPGTVHLAVVDPGVGSARRGLVVQAGEHLFVGPDNGLFTHVFDRVPTARVFEIARAMGLADVHPTFHGRDLFGPTAGRLAAGLAAEKTGTPVSDPVRLDLDPPRCESGRWHVTVLDIDRFGNVTTNLPRDTFLGASGQDTAPALRSVDGVPFTWVRTYDDAKQAELCALWGSSGYLELALRQARADRQLGVKRGQRIQLS